MQNQLLAQYSSQWLQVYAVWLPMLWEMHAKSGTTMSEPRVKHFWDGETIIGQWFAKQVDALIGE